MTAFLRAITHLGGSLPSVAIVAVALFSVHRQRRAARPAIVRDAVLLLAPLAAGVSADALKELVRRPRPPGPALVEAAGWGFPSSHAARSAATSVVVIALLAAYSRSAVVLRSGAVVAVLFASLLGWSRVALHVHYFSDVAAGWLVGIVAACVVVSARRWTIRRARRNTPTDQSEAPDATG